MAELMQMNVKVTLDASEVLVHLDLMSWSMELAKLSLVHHATLGHTICNDCQRASSDPLAIVHAGNCPVGRVVGLVLQLNRPQLVARLRENVPAESIEDELTKGYVEGYKIVLDEPAKRLDVWA